MTDFAARKPDVRISAKCKSTKAINSEVAVGWINKDETISLQLRPGVVLRWNDDLYLLLVRGSSEP